MCHLFFLICLLDPYIIMMCLIYFRLLLSEEIGNNNNMYNRIHPYVLQCILCCIYGIFNIAIFRLRSLKQQLLPLYNFDEDEQYEWESELLEEDKEQHITLDVGVSL